MTVWNDDELRKIKYPAYDEVTEKLARWLLEARDAARIVSEKLDEAKREKSIAEDGAKEALRLLETVSRAAMQTEERLREQGDVLARKLQAAELQNGAAVRLIEAKIVDLDRRANLEDRSGGNSGWLTATVQHLQDVLTVLQGCTETRVGLLSGVPTTEDVANPCPKCQRPTVPFENRRKCLNCGGVVEKRVDVCAGCGERPCMCAANAHHAMTGE